MSRRFASQAASDAADAGGAPAVEGRPAAARVRRWTLVLSGAPLPEALAICLDLLEHDAARFERAAVSWHGRFCAHAPRITIAEVRSALAALDDLQGPERDAAARRLQAFSLRHGLDEVADTLTRWLAGRNEQTGRRAPAASRIDIATEPTPFLAPGPVHHWAVA